MPGEAAIAPPPLERLENGAGTVPRVRVLTEHDTMAGVLLRDGRYEIVGTLGEGAQGTTFEAVDRTTGQKVAIKRFLVKGARSWKDDELAEREAAVLAELSHPALPVHVDHFEESGALYLVMERIEGDTIEALTRRAGALSRNDVLRFLDDAASVLDYLHGRSPPVIHRDINPKNVIRRPDGSFAFVDFGAVRAALKPRGGSTVVGTFGYMAPEQFQGRALPATDVYSVGATALTMLTNVEPENLPHRGLAIDVAAALGGTVAPELREVLERMLEPDPDRRAPRVRPLLDELARRSEPRGNASRRHEESSWRAWERGGRDRTDTHTRRRRDSSRKGSSPDAHDRRDSHAGRYPHEPPWEAWERDVREQWKERHAERHRANVWQAHGWRHRRRGLHGPPLVVALLAIHVALIVVGVTLGVIVPVALTVLSIFFGPTLRNAARDTQRAEAAARAMLLRARQFVLYGPERTEGTETRARVEPAPGPQEPGRWRVEVGGEAPPPAEEEEEEREPSRAHREHRT